MLVLEHIETRFSEEPNMKRFQNFHRGVGEGEEVGVGLYLSDSEVCAVILRFYQRYLDEFRCLR